MIAVLPARRIFVALLCCLGLAALLPVLAVAPAPARRLILDNDGHSTFSMLSADFRRDIDEVVDACPPNVTTYLLCPGAGRYYFPTAVGEVDPRCTRLVAEHARGEDPFGYFLGRLRAADKEVFVTVRMNDVHEPTAADEWNLPKVRRAHPDAIVDAAAVARGDTDWRNWALDYARPEVRAFMLAVIGELIARYDFDGVQLDWMRFPRHLSGPPEEVWAKRHHLTAFVAEVRALCHAKNRRLWVRVPTSLAGCRWLGADIVDWVRRDLVDAVTMASFLNTDFAMPLAEARAAMGAKAVPLFAGFDFEHGAQRHSPESLRAAATGLYASGADALNLFNFPCWIQHAGTVPYDWLAGLESPAAAARKPLLFSVPTTRSRRAYELPGLLPAKLAPGATLRLPVPLPPAALPAARARVLVTGPESTLDARWNGAALEWLPQQKNTEIFVEFTGAADAPGRRATPATSRTYRILPDSLRPGENVLELSNPSAAAVEIKAVNLGLW